MTGFNDLELSSSLSLGNMEIPGKLKMLYQSLQYLDRADRSIKRGMWMTHDIVVTLCSFLLAEWLVLPSQQASLAVAAFLAFLTVSMFFLVGLYNIVTRFIAPSALKKIAASFLLMAAAVMFLLHATLSLVQSFQIALAFLFVLAFFMTTSRVFVQLLLSEGPAEGQNTLIYGAGETGYRLALALRSNRQSRVRAFIDDDLSLRGSNILGYTVYAPNELGSLIKRLRITKVLLAMPSASRRQRYQILQQLEKYHVHVQTIPNIADIVSGASQVEELREVDVNDLLGREPVSPNEYLLRKNVEGLTVMVTGAGGSIGSEICRQVMRLNPLRLILVDNSEAALYSIHHELTKVQNESGNAPPIFPVIGSVLHESRMRDVLSAYRVKTIYHAAAYKHVPLVEHNMVEGVFNNIIGTWRLATAAIAEKVDAFVLVSTDKAVRPTSVMGATKRVAEMILQALNETQDATRFCMVRFGNVLASSGSVVPVFKEQIRVGGPITVTHPEIYRYFMTIPEAASLVIQAGAMSKGGDVFVLDMGEPIKICDLARKLIRLSGLSVLDDDNPDGDISIEYTGLRPAEKLYEELLLGDKVIATEHPKIMRATEEFLVWPVLYKLLGSLVEASIQLDCVAGRDALMRIVTGYIPEKRVSDLIWQERNRGNVIDLGERHLNQTSMQPAQAAG